MFIPNHKPAYTRNAVGTTRLFSPGDAVLCPTNCGPTPPMFPGVVMVRHGEPHRDRLGHYWVNLGSEKDVRPVLAHESELRGA